MHNGDISRDALNAVFSATGTQPGLLSRSQPVMGITGTISVVGASESALEQCWALATHCENRWSRFIDTSDISVLNNAEGVPVVVDPLTVRLLDEMISGADLSAGHFDPTLLRSVIDAGYDRSRVDPERKTVIPDSALSHGNLGGVTIHGETVTLPVGTVIDPGGIGKGLAADLITELAMSLGAWGAMVEFGGDIVVAGQAPGGKAWRIGVENPFGHSEYVDVIRLVAGGVATSSQRKRRFGANHHLINPLTHASALTDVQTVTVIAANGSRAEVLTKPGFVMPPQDYLDWLPSVGAAGLVITEDGTTIMSANWARYR